MTLRYWLCLAFANLLIHSSCSHDHKPPSEELQKAYHIQQSALKSNQDLDEQITSLAAEVTVPQALLDRKTQWLQDMIEIPDMAHDHANCSHDHKRATISLSDKDMIAVQQAWSDTIARIKRDFQDLISPTDPTIVKED